MAGTQVGMIVDITIQSRNEVGRICIAFELFAVDRVGIRLRDDADARPARVTEHCDARFGLAHQESQQVILQNGMAHSSGVVSELTDFCCCLVDE